MNILLTNASRIYGGGEYYVFQLAKELRSRGKNVFVSCRESSLLYKRCEETGIILLPLEYPERGQVIRHCEALRRIIRRYRIRVIHSNSDYDRTVCGFATRFEHIPHVTSVHSVQPLRNTLINWIRNRWATDHYLVDGICVRDSLVRNDRIPSDRISIVHRGIDPLIMKNDLQLGRRVRTSLGLGEHHIVIGNVARMSAFKGHENLIRAFVTVARGSDDARLVLVGDGELLDVLTALAGELCVRDKVIFTGFREDLVALYSVFDIYAHASVEGGEEAFPFAVLQALGHSLPIVVTRAGDIAAMAEDGINGFVVDGGNEDLFAGWLVKLVSDAGMRARFGSESRALLYRKFTMTAMVDRVEKIYNNAINMKL